MIDSDQCYLCALVNFQVGASFARHGRIVRVLPSGSRPPTTSRHEEASSLACYVYPSYTSRDSALIWRPGLPGPIPVLHHNLFLLKLQLNCHAAESAKTSTDFGRRICSGRSDPLHAYNQRPGGCEKKTPSLVKRVSYVVVSGDRRSRNT